MDRKYYFDWLRVIAFSILIFSHVSNIFTKGSYYISNDEKSRLIEMTFEFFRQWRIPLLFFISGAVLALSLPKKTIAKYFKDRLIRLLVPLVFTTLIIIPPIFYIQAMFYNDQSFSPHFFENVISDGTIKWQHMWYVAYILLFSTIAYPLFLFLHRLKKMSTYKFNILSKRLVVVLLIIPLFLVESFMSPHFPFTHQLWNDYYYLTFSFLIFIYGYGFALSEKLKTRLEKDRYLLLGLALVSLAMVFFLNGGKSEINYTTQYFVFKFFKISNIMFSIFAILGFAIKHLNHGTLTLRYANEAVYPFYILHNTILVSVGYFVVQWNISLYIKFVVISFATFFIVFILYEFIIRRVKFLRLLFGCRIDQKVKKSHKPRLTRSEEIAVVSVKNK